MLKALNCYSPPIMENVLVFRENIHNIRNVQVISNKNIKTVICHRTPFNWENLPIDIKFTICLIDFKTKAFQQGLEFL